MGVALAVDMGVAYIASSTLTKAADAGALAAARYGLADGVDAEELAENSPNSSSRSQDLPQYLPGSLARAIAAIVLRMWKDQEVYKPGYYGTQHVTARDA